MKTLLLGSGAVAAGAAAAFLLTAANQPASEPSAAQAVGLPTGMVALVEGSCPGGWADRSSQWEGRYLVVSAAKAGTAVGTALTPGENRPTGDHTHNAPISFYGGNCPTNPTGNCVRWAEAGAGRGPRDPGGVVALNTGESIKPGTNAPYVTLRACVKR